MSTKFWDALRAEVRNMRGVHRNHDELIHLQGSYDSAHNESQRQRIAEQIAERLESQAVLFEAKAHRLARATTALGSPAEYRAEAARWRAGTPNIGP